MQLFPAIDLRGGKVVRLTQGDYDRMTVYGEDPCAQARQFVEAGARYLHVVDLDGAKGRHPFQLRIHCRAGRTGRLVHRGGRRHPHGGAH